MSPCSPEVVWLQCFQQGQSSGRRLGGVGGWVLFNVKKPPPKLQQLSVAKHCLCIDSFGKAKYHLLSFTFKRTHSGFDMLLWSLLLTLTQLLSPFLITCCYPYLLTSHLPHSISLMLFTFHIIKDINLDILSCCVDSLHADCFSTPE